MRRFSPKTDPTTLRAFHTRLYNFTHVPKPTCVNTLNTRIFYVKPRQLATALPAPLGRFSSQAPDRPISQKHRRNLIRAVEAGFKWAEEQEHIDHCPMGHVKVPAAVPRRPRRSLAGSSKLQASMDRLPGSPCRCLLNRAARTTLGVRSQRRPPDSLVDGSPSEESRGLPSYCRICWPAATRSGKSTHSAACTFFLSVRFLPFFPFPYFLCQNMSQI